MFPGVKCNSDEQTNHLPCIFSPHCWSAVHTITVVFGFDLSINYQSTWNECYIYFIKTSTNNHWNDYFLEWWVCLRHQLQTQFVVKICCRKYPSRSICSQKRNAIVEIKYRRLTCSWTRLASSLRILTIACRQFICPEVKIQRYLVLQFKFSTLLCCKNFNKWIMKSTVGCISTSTEKPKSSSSMLR